MCGRFERHSELEEFSRLIQEPVMAAPALFRAERNIFPGTVQPVVRQEHDFGVHATGCRWGLVPSWVDNPRYGKPINARIETATDKPMFRNAIRQRRCLVPCNGFYEWQKLPNGEKQPFHISLADGAPFFLAGIWETNRKLNPEGLDSFAIMTTEASESMSSIHDRMPVIVEPRLLSRWLDSNNDLQTLLAAIKSTAAGTRFHPHAIAQPGA